MRRQFGVGGALPAGSGCMLQLDPLSLPVSFDARDSRADGGIRHIEINRERITVRRAIAGVRMAINVRISDFRGVACRKTDEGFVLMLVHRDPSLTVPLLTTRDDLDLELAWQMWSELFMVPQIEDESETGREPSPRRRRHNVIRHRRPKILLRRKSGQRTMPVRVHRDEYEIIARH